MLVFKIVLFVSGTELSSTCGGGGGTRLVCNTDWGKTLEEIPNLKPFPTSFTWVMLCKLGAFECEQMTYIDQWKEL